MQRQTQIAQPKSKAARLVRPKTGGLPRYEARSKGWRYKSKFNGKFKSRFKKHKPKAKAPD